MEDALQDLEDLKYQCGAMAMAIDALITTHPAPQEFAAALRAALATGREAAAAAGLPPPAQAVSLLDHFLRVAGDPAAIATRR